MTVIGFLTNKIWLNLHVFRVKKINPDFSVNNLLEKLFTEHTVTRKHVCYFTGTAVARREETSDQVPIK